MKKYSIKNILKMERKYIKKCCEENNKENRYFPSLSATLNGNNLKYSQMRIRIIPN